MTNKANKPKRPSSISLIGVFGIYGGFLLFYSIFKTGIQELGVLNTMFFAFSGIGILVCGIGFWFMKKWAVYTYAVIAAINQVTLLVMGRWNVFSLLISVVVVYVGYKHLLKKS